MPVKCCETVLSGGLWVVRGPRASRHLVQVSAIVMALCSIVLARPAGPPTTAPSEAPSAATVPPGPAQPPLADQGSGGSIEILALDDASLSGLAELAGPDATKREAIARATKEYSVEVTALRRVLAEALESNAGHVRAMSDDERRNPKNKQVLIAASMAIAASIMHAESAARSAFEALDSAMLREIGETAPEAWRSVVQGWLRKTVLNSHGGSPGSANDLERHVDIVELAIRQSEAEPTLRPYLSMSVPGIGVPSANASARKCIQESIGEYVASIDRLLRQDCWRRNSMMLELRNLRMRGDADGLAAARRREWKRWEKLEKVTRACHEAIAQVLLDACGAECAAGWRAAVDTAQFPQLYAPKPVDLAYRWLQQRSLEPRTRLQLAEAFRKYLLARTPIRDRMKRDMIAAVTRDGMSPVTVGFQRRTGSFAPVEQSLRAGLALEDTTMRLLRDTIPADMVAEFDAQTRVWFGRQDGGGGEY